MGAMKEILIGFIEPLAKETGYDFEELQEIFFDYLAECHADGTEPDMKLFVGITRERDW